MSRTAAKATAKPMTAISQTWWNRKCAEDAQLSKALNWTFTGDEAWRSPQRRSGAVGATGPCRQLRHADQTDDQPQCSLHLACRKLLDSP